MTTPSQSPLGVFVQSPLGVRAAEGERGDLYVLTTGDVIQTFESIDGSTDGVTWTLASRAAGSITALDAIDATGQTFLQIGNVTESWDVAGTKLWSQALDGGENARWGCAHGGGYVFTISRPTGNTDLELQRRNISTGAVIGTATIDTASPGSTRLAGLNLAVIPGSPATVIVSYKVPGSGANLETYKLASFAADNLAALNTRTLLTDYDTGGTPGIVPYFVHRRTAGSMIEYVNLSTFQMDRIDALNLDLTDDTADDYTGTYLPSFGLQIAAVPTHAGETDAPFYLLQGSGVTNDEVLKYKKSGGAALATMTAPSVVALFALST